MTVLTSRGLLCASAALCVAAALVVSDALDAQGLAAPSFTDTQAIQGKAAYDRRCASCHGGNLDDGEFAPPLKGPDFRVRWGAKPLDTLTHIKTMPPAAPGSLDDLALPEKRRTPAGQTTQPTANPELLRGAIDIHLHSFPDKNPRSLDAIDAAMFARDRGMRAIVLKNHYEPTAGLAYLVRKAVPGIEVFGGIDLNLTVGGINPAAVEYMVQQSGGWGRFVWMPTFDAENQVRYSKESRPFVSVSKDGALLALVRDVIAIIAKNNLVLATGHSSSDEVLMLVREGRRQGVRRMVVTHAMNPPIVMDVTKMKEAAQLGAFIEFVGGSLESADAAARMDRFAAAIKAIGPDFCILSSDLGQKGNALPADGFAAFLAAMRTRGISAQDIDRMTKANPARILGL